MESDQINDRGGGESSTEKHEHGTREHNGHLITVSVNEHPVKLLGHTETGVQIKTAAIEQGVDIHLNFVLLEELPDGKSRVVEDNETVHLHESLRFTAHEKDHMRCLEMSALRDCEPSGDFG